MYSRLVDGQARSAGGFRTLRRRSESQGRTPFAKKWVVSLSLSLSHRNGRSSHSFHDRWPSPSLSHSVGIVTLTYEDRGNTDSYAALTVSYFASLPPWRPSAVHFYNACIYVTPRTAYLVVRSAGLSDVHVATLIHDRPGWLDKNSQTKKHLHIEQWFLCNNSYC